MSEPVTKEKLSKDYESRINHLVENFENQVRKHINEEYVRSTKWSDKFADKIAQFGGSWKFINIFFAFLILWIVLNSLSFTKVIHFDEPPFILLNLVLSFIAGFQAPIIMMSQNRQAARDKQEAIIDFAINYKAEQEIDDMQGHLHRIEADFAKFRSEVRGELSEIKKLILEQGNMS
ncbi:DUF1003 domain-containing protein [Paenibacillus filicis]|uniref:DUF1003 domain-containing protein n=1 Tax=Paenibacillus gyeongsangnamensis TaxID=3388067 RepID=A0ABT4Q847_9BACL|nr:DUF1003 domain-containing protein [Paenibacillus filicis]MCZ8513054.1 DUF1003 domain-containing protein [Paenibacillus filicis]